MYKGISLMVKNIFFHIFDTSISTPIGPADYITLAIPVQIILDLF